MRRVQVMLWFLLLGAIANVAVTWGISVTVDIEKAQYEQFTSVLADPVVTFDEIRGASYVWMLHRGRRFGTVHVYSSEHMIEISSSRFLLDPTHTSMAVPDWAHKGIDRATIDLFADKNDIHQHSIGRGWPMISLVSDQMRPSSSILVLRFSGFGINPSYESTGICLESWPWSNGFPRILPLRPSRWGFAVNTVFYALLLWIPFVARRFVRFNRGLCTVCAYDLRGTIHKQCPECGTKVKWVKIA